jgi:hypothetical protein
VFFDQGLMRVSGASMEQSAFIGALFQFGGSWTGRKTLVRFFRILRAPLKESRSGRNSDELHRAGGKSTGSASTLI